MNKTFTLEEILNALKICTSHKSDKCASCAFFELDSEDCSCVNKLHKSAYGAVKKYEDWRKSVQKYFEQKEEITTHEETDKTNYFGVDVPICPYCGRKQWRHEPNEESSCFAITECENCGKTIEYSVTVTRTYYSSREKDKEIDEYNRKD